MRNKYGRVAKKKPKKVSALLAVPVHFTDSLTRALAPEVIASDHNAAHISWRRDS
jgi:hypothetical protein